MALRGFRSVVHAGARAGLALPLGLALGGCPTPAPSPTPTAGPTTAGVYRADSMDALTDQLAARTRTRLGEAEDFRIIATQAAYPIGTLMRPGSTIPIDYSACLPAAAPPMAKVPSLFPSYALSRETAVDFGLDEAVLKGVAEAGAAVARSNAVKLDFADSAIAALSDSDVGQITRAAACAGLLKDRAVWLVRGYVFGRRTFSMDLAQRNEADLKLAKVASFDVKLANGNSGLAISDAAAIGFLQIVSELKPAPAAFPSPTPSPRADGPLPPPLPPPADTTLRNPVAQVAPITAPRQPGRIYVQRDARDETGTDTKVIAALRAAALPPVSGEVEAIASDKVPAIAQVRYFNTGDAALAGTALDVLRRFYPNATVNRVRLPSPAGQLEVWLPRGGRAQVNPLSVRPEIVASKLLRARQ